ncbi:MAG TPA: hydrogenase expression/formation protein HypE [bacterium (Candidatus Stahlbacteria)]|nr:hydrogenase expression/formation protein HypE [Candidatus Stahlbacteria bacterium]
MSDRITLGHGSGGGLMRELIKEFREGFKLSSLEDAVEIEGRIALTTDSFVVKPIFFPGGDIGKLSITGTVNDLAMKGAIPEYILISYIIEEGFPTSDLSTITRSAQQAAKESGVKVIGGDTKVVEKGSGDGLYLTTFGVGTIPEGVDLKTERIEDGDQILINGWIGDHGIAVLNAREGFGFSSTLISDCAPLTSLVQTMLNHGNIKFMRDPTRGGVATVLNEVFEETGLGIVIEEEKLPIRNEVRGACELLGLDPLYVANEGKLLAFAGREIKDIISSMQNTDHGEHSCQIGYVDRGLDGVYLKTSIGSLRPLLMLAADPLPRIC